HCRSPKLSAFRGKVGGAAVGRRPERESKPHTAPSRGPGRAANPLYQLNIGLAKKNKSRSSVAAKVPSGVANLTGRFLEILGVRRLDTALDSGSATTQIQSGVEPPRSKAEKN